MSHIRYFTLLTMICVALIACRESMTIFDNEPLITAGESVVTVADYMQALEISKTAYPLRLLRQKEELKAIKKRLLSQMIEELVVEKVAKEKNIILSDEEFKKAVDEIKKDYPEGEFENLLVETAVTNRLWESRLRKRLLMEKVLDTELKSKISIGADDINAYYEKNKSAIQTEFDNEESQEDEKEIYDRMIRHMKMEKKQSAYQAWMDKKKADYSIEVNQKIWEKILDQ